MDTVLITGIGGFIARHVAQQCLAAGYRVRGTVRSAAKAEPLRELFAHQSGATNAGNLPLEFVEADLTRDAGWAEAMAGCRFVLHVASPFPLDNPGDREALVPAAMGGTLRVLDAALAADVERVVLTSSVVSMMYRAGRPARFTFSEGDWTDPEWAPLTAYQVSKTRAEAAAWQRTTDAGARERLVTVNPGLVLGPSLGSGVGASLEVIEMLMRGKYPAVPPLAFPIVDVRDVAALHVAALTVADVGGRRLLAASDTMSLKEIARTLKDALGRRARKVPLLELPAFMVRSMAALDPALRAAQTDLGVRSVADARYVTELTGLTPRPAREAVTAAGVTVADVHGL